jgi:hypothetical protein
LGFLVGWWVGLQYGEIRTESNRAGVLCALVGRNADNNCGNHQDGAECRDANRDLAEGFDFVHCLGFLGFMFGGDGVKFIIWILPKYFRLR